ncbi:MAG: ATP-dependent DNA helicase RecG, partial [Treponema sp.]|nr:ATP-dependent DNA helicase RecG [Treponema sp.]
FSRNVVYNDLSLAIIDEQHRFGVMQRSAIVDKAQNSLNKKINGANLLMMSATPIPQTLAQTVFSDLDVFTIKTMPSGRKPVQTYLTKEGNERNAYEAVRQELRQGRQAYFVYPAIGQETNSPDSSERDEEMSLKAAEDMFRFLSTQVYPEYKCALVHGKIDDEEQSRILREFKEGSIQILVATTVVEVGVDNPNATCMVIEQADRFGLAALHQLRGRVGRGSAQSYCFLIYSKNISQSGIERMKAIRQTTDGFKIAEEDLKLRGPGQITGTLQSGQLTFAIADLARDSQLMAQARLDAFNYYTMLRTTQGGVHE